MNQEEAKQNVKELIEELMTIYVSLPKSEFKNDIGSIVQMIRHDVPLKNILLYINKKIETTKTPTALDQTIRKQQTKFWEYVLKLFTSHLKPQKKQTKENS